MSFMVNYLLQHWGLLVTLFLSGGTCAYIVRAIIRKSRSTWQARVLASIPAPSPMDRPMVPRTVKTSTATWIILILILLLPVSGYMAGTHLQSERDAKETAARFRVYDSEYAAWKQRSAQWAKDYEVWKAKNIKEKDNARRLSTTTTGTTTAPTTAESSQIGRGSG